MMVSLRCPNSTCQFKLQNPQGSDCYSNIPSKSMICTIDLNNIPILNTYTDCYIDECDRVYTICNISQNQQNSSSESSPRCGGLTNGGNTVHSNEQPINCTVTLVPSLKTFTIHLRCPKGECSHTAISNNLTCSRDLGIDCGGKQTILLLTDYHKIMM